MSPLAPAVVLALAVAPVLQSAAAPVSARLEADVRQETPLWVQLQRADGGWSAASVPAGEGVVQGRADDDVLVTGLLTLAMLGDGKTPSAGPCKENVRGALDFLLAAQAEDGRVGTSPSVASQAVAAFALSEAAFLGQDEACANGARRAVRWLEQRALAGGGWAATAGETEVYDARATCWATLALVSARSSALVEAPQLVAAAAWRARTEGDDAAEADTRALSFELVTRLMAGETALAAPELRERAAVLLARPVAWTPSGEGFDAETYYLRSLLAYNLGGEAWKGWHATMKAVLKAGADGGALLAVDPSVPGGSLAALGYGTLALLAAGQKPGRGSASTRCEPQVTLHVLTRQRADGLWSAATLLPEAEGTHPGTAGDDALVTALFTLALLMETDAPDEAPYGPRCVAALDGLVARQGADGRLASAGSTTPLADHAIATLALSEAAVLWGDDARLAALEAAVALLRRTALEDGGWPVAPGERDLDARTTCWAAMALRSARDAGLRAPGLVEAAAWRLRDRGLNEGGLPAEDVAWELWTRLLADETYEHGAPLEARVDELLAVAPSWRADGVDVRPERVLMQTLVAQRVGGERWRAWTKVLNREVLRARDLQVTGGTARERARLVCDERTRGGGLAAWSYDALAFEVYFKYWRLVGVR